jgi:hypothetical protein
MHSKAGYSVVHNHLWLPVYVAFQCVFHNDRNMQLRSCCDCSLQVVIHPTTQAQQGRLLSGADSRIVHRVQVRVQYSPIQPIASRIFANTRLNPLTPSTWGLFRVALVSPRQHRAVRA